MTLPPGQLSREQLKSRLDHSLRLHREWAGWVGGEGSAASRPPHTPVEASSRSASVPLTPEGPKLLSPAPVQQVTRASRPVSALRRVASASASNAAASAAGWTPISRSNDELLHQSAEDSSVVHGDGQPAAEYSFAGLSVGEVLSLAGLQQAVLKPAGGQGCTSNAGTEGRTMAVLEALCVIVRSHPLLGPIVSALFELTAKSLFPIPMPFLCEASTPPHQTPGSDNAAHWTKWIDARAARLGKVHTHRMGALCGSGATLLLSTEMSQMSDELRANRVTAQAAKRNSQQLRLNYVQSRKLLKMHFKAWRDTSRGARSKMLAAERIARIMHLGIKRTVFLRWRLVIVSELLDRKAGHCERMQHALQVEGAKLQSITERFEDNQRQRDIAITSVEHMRGIAADLERRLAQTKSAMVLDFRRPLTVLHKTSAASGDLLESGTVHFRLSGDSFASTTSCEDWHGEYGCERMREGVAMPGREKYASRYHIRVEGTPSRVLDPTLEWANQAVIAFCRAHMSGPAVASFGPLSKAFDQFIRDSDTRIGIWSSNAAELREVEKDNIVQLTPSGTVTMACDLSSFSDLASFPYVYAALAAEIAPVHVHLTYRSLSAFVASATLPSVFAVLKSAGLCGGFSEAEFTETKRVSPGVREGVHRLVLCRMRTMGLLKGPWDALGIARNPSQHQQQSQPAGASLAAAASLVIGQSHSGVLRLRKGPTLAELVVQRSSADGLADETAEDVLAWVRDVLTASQVQRAAAPTSQTTTKPRRRVLAKKSEEDLLQSDTSLLQVANLEEDTGDGLAFLALVIQCLIPYDSALPEMASCGTFASSASLKGSGHGNSKRLSPRSPRRKVDEFVEGKDKQETSVNSFSVSLADTPQGIDEADAEAEIPTDTQALATYLCTTARDVLRVPMPPLVWSSLHTCTRSVKMVFLTALYLKFSCAITEVCDSSPSVTVIPAAPHEAVVAAAQSAVSPRSRSPRASPSPRRGAADPSHHARSPRNDHNFFSAVPGNPAMAPPAESIKQLFPGKDGAAVRHLLTRYTPLLCHVFLRLAALRAAGPLRCCPSAFRELLVATNQPREIVAAFDAYSESLLRGAPAGAADQTPSPATLELTHTDLTMAVLHTVKACAASSGESADAVLQTLLRNLEQPGLDSLVCLDFGGVRRELMSHAAVTIFRAKAKLLTAIYVKYSDWIDDKYRLLEQRCMREPQFLEAIFVRCLDAVDEGPGAFASAWSLHRHVSVTSNISSPAKRAASSDLLAPLASCLDGSQLVKSEFAVRSAFHVVSWTRAGDMKAAENIAAQLGVVVSPAMIQTATGERRDARPSEPTLRYSGFLEALAAVSRSVFPSPWVAPDVKLAVLLEILEGCHLDILIS
jgi:hypothetical protein